MSIDAVPKPFHGPWEGDTKIVLGIDIGITQSSVVFTFLQNGASQLVQYVTMWPGPGVSSNQPTVPTLIWYDSNKKAVSCGAEALSPEAEEQAEDNGWFLAKHFTLHLHPVELRAHDLKLDSLPPGITLRQVYSDFLGYLLEHTRSFFEGHVIDGKHIWERYSPKMEIVIAHPNGWGVREQAFLRSAAVAAGISTSDLAASKVGFVTEGEASVHFCMHRTTLGNVLRAGTGFAVCDAGNSMVETTLYSVISACPLFKLEEKRASACIQAGAIFVDAVVERFLRKTLEYTELDQDDIADFVKRGMEDFGAVVKWAFKDETAEQKITLANTRFNNPSIGIRRGCMTLSGSTIKEFFDGCVKGIIASVDEQLDRFDGRHILLIGEFGNIPYLRQVFQKRYEPQGYRVFLVDNYSGSVASAAGAVLWSAMATTYRTRQRTPRSSWGIEISVAFNSDDPDHQDRKSQSTPSGRTVASGRWHCLVRKGVAIDENAITQIPVSLDFPPSSHKLGEFKLDLYNYAGDGEPKWMRDKQGGLLFEFCKVVRVYIDLEGLRGALKSRIDRDGILQSQLNFDACMRFGGVELVAYSEWEEEGVIRTGDCRLVPIVDEL